MTAAWKISCRLSIFILAARGLDKLINTVFMLNLDAIWSLDDKSKLPLFALAVASEEHIGKIMALFFCIKIQLFLTSFCHRHAALFRYNLQSLKGRSHTGSIFVRRIR